MILTNEKNDETESQYLWAVVRVDGADAEAPRWIVRKGLVMHRELRRVGLSFEGELYRWFRPGEDLFESSAEAEQQAARYNESPPERRSTPELTVRKP
ncbi:MAG TPA: hypothetical protein VFJ58_21765 [Armatimonadota bacterium]|nr:hypothetical protein [Armatimonadota bacterium]